MGTITRSFANNITTSGVLLPASLTNNSIANVTSYNASIATGGMKLISTQTANNSASLSFTTGIDSTYKEYQFWFIDIHARTDGQDLTFQGSTDGGSNYGINITSSYFGARHNETGTDGALGYNTGFDLAQSTSFQPILRDLGQGADENGAGYMSLFNPASTTYVKHFISRSNKYQSDNASYDTYNAGYGNTTSAVNAIRFQFSSGNIADGTIYLYAIDNS